VGTLPDMRVYISGCGGMLGEAFYHHLKNNDNFFATDIDINDSFLEYGDVRDADLVSRQIATFAPNLVVNLAALTDVEYCELHPKEAHATNTLGTHNVLTACKSRDIPMVHISTAGVFDGAQEEYDDDAIPNPINVYGKTKLVAEQMVAQYPKHYIFRAGWMMGGGAKKDKKFVNKILKKIENGEKELFVVDDKFGTPTYTHDLVQNIFTVIAKESYGLYHSVCEGSASRYDVAEYILKELGRDDIVVRKVSSDFVAKEYHAPRPASEKLVNKRLKEQDLYTMRSWQDCLREYLIQWK
jgi:dTDP-4-dehydrorhamnose reductase